MSGLGCSERAACHRGVVQGMEVLCAGMMIVDLLQALLNTDEVRAHPDRCLASVSAGDRHEDCFMFRYFSFEQRASAQRARFFGSIRRHLVYQRANHLSNDNLSRYRRQ